MSFAPTVTLAQAANLIATCGGTNTILLQGPPGIGKSAILGTLAKKFPEYHVAYIDVANLDLGDIAMPLVDKESMVTHYAPNARFGVARGQNKPVLLMLDELGKASRPVLNMLLPLIHEQRLGDVNLPEGSIVFATTNLATDGVQDTIPAHAYNRMTVLRVQNPTADEWIEWAMDNNVDAAVVAFAKQTPQIFDCYADLDKDVKNPYIFDPRLGNVKAFCSPRSLERASYLVANREKLGAALMPALAGTIGEPAARDMEAMVHLADSVPLLEEVIKAPKKCRLPDGVGAYFLMAFRLAGNIDEKNLDAIAEYVARWEDSLEASALFVRTVVMTKTKLQLIQNNRKFMELAKEYAQFFS
jgi:hypothetical protein